MPNPYLDLIPGTDANVATGGLQSAPQPTSNPYMDLIPQADDQQVKLRASLSQGVQANPAEVVKQRQAADSLGVPPAAVQALPSLQNAARVQQIDDATRTAPATRQAFTDQEFAALAHPDADRLAKIENVIKYTFGATNDGSSLVGDVLHDTASGLGSTFNTLGKNASLAVGAVPTIYDKAASVLSGKTDTSAQDWWFSHFVQPLADNQAALDPGQGFGHRALHAVGGLAGTLAQIVLTGGESAAPALAEAPSALSAIAQNLQHAVKVMAIPATSDAIGTAQRVYEATGDAGSAIRAAQAQYAVSTLGGAAPLSVAGRLATRVLTGFGVGAVQGEASREAMNLVLPDSLQQKFDPEELALSGIIGMGMASAMGPRAEPNLYPAIRQAYIDAAKAEAAQKAAGAVDTLSTLAEQSELREHDPATFKQLVGKMAEDPDALKAVYAKGAELDAVMQQHGVTDGDLQQTMPAVAKGLAEARQTGGDVRIPIEDYATHIAGSPLDDALRPVLRVDPEGMTVKESQDYYQTQVEQFQKTAESAIAGKTDELQRRSEADEIRDTVAQQLQEAGRTPAAAKVEAELARTFFATMSERAGMTPRELFDKSGFSVQGGQSRVRPGGVLDQSAPSLQDVRDQWDAAGIKHAITEKDGVITVGQIVVPEGERGQGKGTAAMEALTRYADATGQHVALTPAGDFGGNVKRLKQFYKRFGFVENKGKNRAFTTSESMYRVAPDKELEQQARGSFNPDTGTISLLKDADLSTFSHELGHFALETQFNLAREIRERIARVGVADATPGELGLIRDSNTLLKWFGVNSLEDWHKMSVDEQRPHHENFARGFEAYLMEGKAPTQELQGIFGRIRSWMLSVYQSLKALNVELTPEVRTVMDRLLASEDAIREAEQTRGYFGLDKLPEGTDPKDAQDYHAMGQEATQEAISEMGARSIRDMRWLSNAKNAMLRKLQGEANAARKAIREEVTKEVDESPAMNAKAALEQLEAQHEASPLSADMNAQLVAEAHGFQTVEAMHNAIREMGDRDTLIDNLTDLRMLQEHGELTDPKSIERAAEAAIHNDARARFMATGLKILTKSQVPARELAAAAKEAAQQIIAGKAIGDLRPEDYSAAEARANKAMLKAAPKDPAAAVQAQRSALLNNRLYKVARDAQEEVRKALDYIAKFSKDSVRAQIDLDVRDQIDDLLDRFDFRKNPPPDGEPTREQVNLQNWLEAQRAAGYNPSVSPEAADPRVRKPYKELTVEQFRGMVDSLKALEQVGRERKTITVDGRKQDLDAFVTGELVPKIQERGQNFTPEQLLEKPTGNFFKVALSEFSSFLRAVGAQLKPIEFKRNEYDRHEILGPFGRAIFEPIMRANYRKVDMLKGLSKDFGDMAEKLGKAWQESLHDPVTNTTLVDPDLGRPMAFTRGRMLGMALHVGNESNFDKLTKGWGWQPEAVMQFLKDNMTANDWHAVQSVWDLYEKHWPETEAMYRRLGQTIPEKIPARGFNVSTADGQLLKVRGGYAAITYDALRSKRGERQAAGEAIDPSAGLFGRDYYSRNTPTNGSMNARVAGYTDRVSLDYGDVARKLQESIHDLAYREPLIDAHKIIEHPEFRKAFREAYGREAYKSLQEWLGRLANSNNMDRSVGALGKFLQWTRTGMVINAIAFRATTVLKHGGSAGIKTMGYFAGGGEKYLASRMAAMGHDYSNQIAEAKEKFPEIRARLMQQDRDFRATSHALFEKDSKLAQAERFGHAAVAWSDMMTAVPTAHAAYDRAVTEGIPVSQGGTGQPMTHEQAVAYADKVVREAHGTNIEAGRSMVLNTDSEGLKLFTTLYGFMNNTYGQTADAWDKLHTAGISNTPVLARTFMALIVPAIWAGLLKGGPDEKKDESWGHWSAAAIAEEVAAQVPFVRDAASMVEGYKGAGMVPPENWVATMVQALKDIYKATGDEESKGSPIRDVANAVGMGLHLPGAGQIGTSLQYLENVRTGKESPENVFDFARGLVTGHGPRP